MAPHPPPRRCARSAIRWSAIPIRNRCSPARTRRHNRNKQAALHIQRELLKCSDWARAGEWLTDKYIQHNPVAASGLKGVQNYFVNIAKRKPLDPCPALSASDSNAVVAVMAEGDYVTILTRREVPYADDPSKSYTTSWFDTWRFVDGKADEHWDPATLPAGPPPPPPPPPGGMASRDADKDAIEALMWRYDRALDKFNADAYVALYTEDGSFGQTKGRDALYKMMSGFTTPRPRRRRRAGRGPRAGRAQIAACDQQRLGRIHRARHGDDPLLLADLWAERDRQARRSAQAARRRKRDRQGGEGETAMWLFQEPRRHRPQRLMALAPDAATSADPRRSMARDRLSTRRGCRAS